MMIKLSIVGTITSQFEGLVEVINGVLPTDVLMKQKIRVLGEEISASSENFSLYIYKINQNNYQIEANFFNSIRAGLTLLDQLAIVLQAENISYVFDYCLSDNRGNCLTKEKSRSFSKALV